MLVLAAVAVSLVVAMAGSTGAVEKVVLACLFVLCVAMGVGVTSAAAHFRKRIVHR